MVWYLMAQAGAEVVWDAFIQTGLVDGNCYILLVNQMHGFCQVLLRVTEAMFFFFFRGLDYLTLFSKKTGLSAP